VSAGHAKSTFLALLLVLAVSVRVPAQEVDKRPDEALGLTEAEKEWLAAHPVVTVAPDPDFPPFEFFDEQGVYRGIGADYVKLIEERTGLRFKVVRLGSWEEVLAKARSGEVDVLAAANATPDRAMYLLFTKPYVVLPAVIVVRRQIERDLTADDLQGMKVAAVSGYATLEALKIGYPDIELDVVPDVGAGLRKVSLGMVDAMVENLGTVSYYTEKEGITNLRVAGQIGPSCSLAFATRGGMRDLNGILQKCLDSISPEQKAEILGRWVHLEHPSPIGGKRFWTALAVTFVVAALVMFAVVWWNRSLREQVRARTSQLEKELAERKRAEEELRDSEARMRGIFSSLHETTIAIYDRDGNHLAVWGDPALAERYGLELSDARGMSIRDFFPPEEGERKVASIRSVFDTGEPRREEYCIHLPKGDVWNDITLSPVSDPNGKVRGVVGFIRDITDRKRAEEHNRIQRDLAFALGVATSLDEALRLCIDAALIVPDLDCAGIYLLEEETGALELVCYKGVSEQFVASVSRFDKDSELVRRIVEGEPVYRGVDFYAAAAGEPKNLEGLQSSAAIPIRHEGRIVGSLLVGSHTHVEMSRGARGLLESMAVPIGSAIAHLRAEEALRESEEKYRNLIEHSIEGIGISKGNSVVFVNSALLEIFGYDDAEEVHERSLLDLIAPESRDVVRERIVAREQGRDVAPRYEMKIVRKNGERRDIEISTAEVMIGKERCVQSTFRDVTDRNRAEAALKDSEEKFRALAENLPDMIVRFDRQNRHLYANPAMERLSGICAADLAGKTYRDIGAPQEVCAFFEERIRKVFESAEMLEDELEYAASGRGVILNVRLTPEFGPDGTTETVLCIARDVTEHRRMEERLRQAERMQAIGQLAGGIAHDFNNLLTGIMGYADLLDRGLKNDKKLRVFAKGIVETSGRAAELTAQLLAFSRRRKMSTELVDLHTVIADVVSLLEHTIDRRIVIRRELKAESPVVMGDSSQLQSAVLNLAVNARDAMPNGGELTFATSVVKLDEEFRRLHPDVDSSESYIELCVRDTGIGMKSDVVEHIFEPFFTTKGVGKGTGLGLSAVYGTVREHRGAVDVDSQPGKGSVFRLYLPLARQFADLPKGSLPNGLVHGQGRILLVDDEEYVRRVANEMLTRLGYEVVQVENGRDAIETYRQRGGEIDLVMLDMIMPELSGTQTLEAIREIDSEARILIVSGYSSDTDALNLEGTAIQGLIWKPFAADRLSQAVADAMRRSPGEAD